MRDNIGNEIHVGDAVFCFSGHFKNTIQRVSGFRYCNGNTLNGVTDAVNLSNGYWLDANNIVS